MASIGSKTKSSKRNKRSAKRKASAETEKTAMLDLVVDGSDLKVDLKEDQDHGKKHCCTVKDIEIEMKDEKVVGLTPMSLHQVTSLLNTVR